MKTTLRKQLPIIGGACLFLLLGISGSSYTTRTNLIAPAWAEGGKSVIFIRRVATMLEIGPPLQMRTILHFPWDAKIISDTLRLEKVDPLTRRTTRLANLGAVPDAGLHFGTIFDDPVQEVAAKILPAGNGTYRVALGAFDRDPARTRITVFQWAGQSHPRIAWRTGDAEDLTVRGMEVIRGNEELAVLGDPFPYAIVTILDGKPGRVILSIPEFADHLYSTPLALNDVLGLSERKQIRRLAALQEQKPRLKAQYLSQGLSEAAADLKADNALTEMGILPRGAGIVARSIPLAPPGVRTFKIPGQRFDVGLFSDLRRAMAHPGKRIPEEASYFRYGNDNTGPELEAFLEQRPNTYVVERDGKLWLITRLPADE